MKKYKVIEIRHLTALTFVIRLERNGLRFQTGQFVLLGLNGTIDRREYSIYSGENDDFLEVLVREVNDGKVSRRLKQLKTGDTINLDGPFGFFKFIPETYKNKKFIFVATGTGISPFHSFIKTYPKLRYELVHGVRFGEEAYEHHDFSDKFITLCTSGDSAGRYFGRVTQYLNQKKIDSDANYFLCGNSSMIGEVFDILTSKGVSSLNIYSEVYF